MKNIALSIITFCLVSCSNESPKYQFLESGLNGNIRMTHDAVYHAKEDRNGGLLKGDIVTTGRSYSFYHGDCYSINMRVVKYLENGDVNLVDCVVQTDVGDIGEDVVYSYEDGEVARITTTSEVGGRQLIVSYEYVANGQVLEYIDSQGNPQLRTRLLTHEGRLESSEGVSNDGETRDKTIYQYDSRNLLEKKSRSGSWNQTVTYDYLEFDERENWTRLLVNERNSYENGNTTVKQFIVERKLAYRN